MDDILFINLFARVFLVACPIVAFRFAKRRKLRPRQSLVLCAVAGAVSNLLFVGTVVVARIVWVPSIEALVLGLARSTLYYAACGLVLGAVGLWRRVASTSRLALIGLATVAAMDLIHIVVDPMLGLPRNQTRPVMLLLALVLGTFIYIWNPGAERELSVAEGETEI